MLTEKQTIRVKMKLVKHGYNISKLATELCVARPTLSEIINGKRNDKELEEKVLDWKKGE